MGIYDDILNYLASPRQKNQYITNPRGIASIFPKGTTPRTSRAFLPGGRKYRYDQFDREQDNLSSFEQKKYYRKGVPPELFRGNANATYGPGGANIGPRYAPPSPTAGGPLSTVRPNVRLAPIPEPISAQVPEQPSWLKETLAKARLADPRKGQEYIRDNQSNMPSADEIASEKIQQSLVDIEAAKKTSAGYGGLPLKSIVPMVAPAVDPFAKINPFGGRTGRPIPDSGQFTDPVGAVSLRAVEGATAAPVAKSARASAVPLPMPRPIPSVKLPARPVAPDAPAGLPRDEGRDDLNERPNGGGPNESPVIADPNVDGAAELDAGMGVKDPAQATAKDPVQEPVDEKSFLDNEWVRLGLNMMVAASKPGATALGAFGEGALATISDRDKRKVINEDRAFKKEVLGLKAGYAKAEGDRGREVARERLRFAFRQHADAEKRFAKDFDLKEEGLIDRQLMSEAEISNIESNIEHRKEMRRIGQLSSEEDKKLAYLNLDSSRKKSDKTLLSAIYRSAGVAIKELMDSLENNGEFQGKTPEEKVEFVKKAYTSFTSNRAGDPATADVIKGSFGQTIIDSQIRILFPKASTDPANVR